MKRIISLVLIVAFVLSTLVLPTAAVENEVTVTLDGFKLVCDVPARLIGDRTMVPVRAIFEALGAEVKWVAETRDVIATRGEDTIKLTIGSNELYKNNELAYTMDTVPVIIEENGESRTLVPARAVSEAFGCTVDWDAETRTAIITDINDSTVLVAAGFPIDYDTYSYYCNTLISYFAPDPAELEADPALAENFEALVLEAMLRDYSVNHIAAALGYTKYDPELSTAINTALDAYKSQYGDALADVLTASYMSEEVFIDLLYASYFNDSITETLYGAFDLLSEEDVAALFMNDENFIRAIHILVEDEAVANEILDKAKSASDEEFVALATEIGTDPGMAGNADGYYFSRGEMVKEFEDTAFALAENETSDIVSSEYGYHIIRRLPKDDEFINANIVELISAYVETQFYSLLEKTALEVIEETEFLDKYNEIDIINDFIKPFYERIEADTTDDVADESDSETIDEAIAESDSFTEENNGNADDDEKFKKLI